MKHLTLPTAFLVLALTGCQATKSQGGTIDDALLSELSSTSMASVVEARFTRDTAADTAAKADRDMRWAEEQVELVRSNLKVARAELDDAKLAMVVAENSGTVSQHEAATKTYEYSLARADEVRELLALRKREFELSKLSKKIATEDLRLKNAQVELRKAEAVQELDRVGAKRVPVKDYVKQVRFHETEVELARVRANAMAAEVEDARGVYEAARAKAEELKAAS